MNSTTVLHVRYNGLVHFWGRLQNHNVIHYQILRFLDGEPQQLIFRVSIWYSTLSLHIQPRIALTLIDKLNASRDSRDSSCSKICIIFLVDAWPFSTQNGGDGDGGGSD